jgi:two-component system sensor histidine kinase PilS (NtrC family)
MKSPKEDSREEPLKKLQWLMLLRVTGVTFFLGTTILIHFTETHIYFSPSLLYLYTLIGTIYFLTVLYVILLKLIRNLKLFAYMQILVDVLFIAGVNYATGGMDSVFSFMYIFPIIYASILLYRKGGLLIASASSIIHGVSLDLEFYGVIHPLSTRLSEIKTTYPGEHLFYNILMDISAFYLVAILSSLLSEQLKRSQAQLKEREIDLHDLETLNQNIIQSMGSGLLTLDADERIVFLNRAGEEILGLNFLEVCNAPLEEIFSDGEIPRNVSRGYSRWEAIWKRKDGTELHLGFSVSPLKDSVGKSRGTILIFQDLTRFKEMEEKIKRAEKLAAIGQLAAGIAHEIRNPLASMSGSIQLLEKELRLDPESKRLMDIVLRETDRLNLLISEFLLFAQPDQKAKEVIILKDLIEDTLGLFVHNPEWKKGIELRKDLEEGIWLEANPEEMRQILWNLLVNAAQSMSEGGILTITSKMMNGYDGQWERYNLKSIHIDKMEHSRIPYAEITIGDTGTGIHKKNLDKIFDPFFTTKESGTGLGLAIVYRIVENYQGSISVKSVPGKGTVFTIRFPLIKWKRPESKGDTNY